VDIVRDVLDELVVDRNGREMGRVDGIELAQASGPPRVAALLIGPSVLGSRLHPAIGRLVTALERRLGLDRCRPVRIDVADVDRIEGKVHLRLTISETAAAAAEEWLRGWILELPGSR
jgi:hypothetical protein